MFGTLISSTYDWGVQRVALRSRKPVFRAVVVAVFGNHKSTLVSACLGLVSVLKDIKIPAFLVKLAFKYPEGVKPVKTSSCVCCARVRVQPVCSL